MLVYILNLGLKLAEPCRKNCTVDTDSVHSLLLDKHVDKHNFRRTSDKTC